MTSKLLYKIDPPGMFCLIILQPEHLTIDAESWLTFEKFPLKLKISQNGQLGHSRRENADKQDWYIFYYIMIQKTMPF